MVACITLMACGDSELASDWKGEQQIVVDGTMWDRGTALRSSEELALDYGVMNDDRFLYIALSPLDEGRQRQILTSGLSLWFDPTLRGRKLRGLRFPVGAMPHGEPSDEAPRPPERGEVGPHLESPRDHIIVIASIPGSAK